MGEEKALMVLESLVCTIEVSRSSYGSKKGSNVFVLREIGSFYNGSRTKNTIDLEWMGCLLILEIQHGSHFC
jgi:hypothetical protein